MEKKRVQVRFAGGVEDKEDKNAIEVSLVSVNSVQISLGILKAYHRYQIETSIPSSVLEQLLESSEELRDGLTPNIQLQSFSRDSAGLNMIVEICTDDAQTFEETITLGKNLINFTASVLGPNKGTPYLRKNIHLLAKIPCESSSDDD